MFFKILLATSLLAVAGAGIGVASLAANTERADCPGKIECPLTGEIVCRDECPRVDPNRPDCPGRIECPIDGELVCKDRCPAESGAASACCATGVDSVAVPVFSDPDGDRGGSRVGS